MTRVKRGYTARRRRKKSRSFVSASRGAHSRLARTITQQEMKALASSHRDRGGQKRDFRRLWIARINGGICENDNKVLYSYSRLMHNLYKKQLLLNRKIPAQIAISNKNCLFMVSKKIIRISRNILLLNINIRVIYSTEIGND